MAWESLQNILRGMTMYSTMFGCMWLCVVFIFRVLVFVVAALSVWGEEINDFVCNTKQPGCTFACYNSNFPISHVRLWALQLIFITSPSLLVMLHIRYRMEKNKRYAEDHTGLRLYDNPVRKNGGLWWTYLLSLFLKAGFDGAFIYIVFYIYGGFNVPLVFECSLEPCPDFVDCFTARPTEKKIFTLFMVVTSAICILTCVCEILYLIAKRTCQVVMVLNKRVVEQRAYIDQATLESRYIRADPTSISDQTLSQTNETQAEISIW